MSNTKDRESMTMPKDGAAKALLQQVAAALDDAFNGRNPDDPAVGFVLLTFDMKKGPSGGMVNYVSNCQRASVVAALKELLARWEGRFVEAGQARQ